MKNQALEIIKQFESLEEKISQISPQDNNQMIALSRERKKLEPIVLTAQEWLDTEKELNSLEDIIRGPDAAMADLAKNEKIEAEKKLADLNQKFLRLLNPPNPLADRNCIIEIRAGAGGEEAALFVGDLFKMYLKFAQRKGLNADIFSSNPTGLGGFKEVIFGISGPNAFGTFKYEQGVHRVQRVPKTEAQGRIHTSTATVAVLPEANEIDVKVDLKDLRIDTYRASGAGGQHVNKTESAIRITHVPTGLVVACQEERSQGQNRLRAMTLLRSRLYDAAKEKADKERSDLRKRQVGTGDRSEKIRTYNFPQDRITDHRINFSVFHIESVLEGEMDDLIQALQIKEEELVKKG